MTTDYEQDSRSVPLAFVQLPNTFVCTNFAMANMIYYMKGGGMEKAQHFLRICDGRTFYFEAVKELNTILRKVFPTKTFRKVDPNKFDVLETEIPFDRPTIVQLESTGGYATHAIGIMKDVIFDSCNYFTLKRTKENLDHACRPMQFRSVRSVSQLVDDDRTKPGNNPFKQEKEVFQKIPGAKEPPSLTQFAYLRMTID